MSKNMDRLREQLLIERDALSDCLIEQPQLYFDVATGHAESVARRDALKLDVEEVQAEVDKRIRADAVVKDVKLTEAAIQQQLKLDAKVADLAHRSLAAREETDRWAALREAYQQRSFMLRELVALHVSERHDVALSNGAGQRPTAVAAVAEHNMRATSDARKQFRVRGKVR